MLYAKLYMRYTIKLTLSATIICLSLGMGISLAGFAHAQDTLAVNPDELTPSSQIIVVSPKWPG